MLLPLAALLPQPLMGAFAPAFAQTTMGATLPHYDYEKYCHKISGLTGGASPTLFNNCLHSETEQRRQAARQWPKLSPGKRAYCDRLAQSSIEGRYARLRSCVDQELVLEMHQKREKKAR